MRKRYGCRLGRTEVLIDDIDDSNFKQVSVGFGLEERKRINVAVFWW